MKQINVLRLKEEHQDELHGTDNVNQDVQSETEDQEIIGGIHYRGDHKVNVDEESSGNTINQPIDTPGSDSQAQQTIPQLVSQPINKTKQSLQIGKLQFGIECENCDMVYCNQHYTSISYSYICKNEDRLGNIPGGSIFFTYKNHSYPFDSSSCLISKFKTSIIEVTISYLLYS